MRAQELARSIHTLLDGGYAMKPTHLIVPLELHRWLRVARPPAHIPTGRKSRDRRRRK